MTYIVKPKFHHPALPVNGLGFTHRDYEGTISTLCAGCGHDSISAAIIQSCFELDIPPHRVAKMSGIGCSSKTPTYFLGQSHGFNSVHGRMPAIATGANLANRALIYLGVSGDGDSASIGLGQFAHCIRRGVGISPYFLSMLPYLFTIAVLVLATGETARRRLGAPAALGRPYVREER
jgi:2-oxoglutarate ferredoxin oxidoreductase subunit beta